MTESNRNEPLWVGMDVDAELAQYAEEDRVREAAGAKTIPAPKSSLRRRSLRDAIPGLGKGGVPQFPLTA